MSEIIIECKDFTRFKVNKENKLLIKNIVKLCQDYGLEVKMVD